MGGRLEAVNRYKVTAAETKTFSSPTQKGDQTMTVLISFKIAGRAL